MDLAVVESKNGGELVRKGNDLLLINGWGNMIYLAMFGGNVEAVTGARKPGEQAFDWWGNSVLMDQQTSIQFNSYTERTLNDTVLNSAGRVTIQQAVEKDLIFMKEIATVKVTVLIVDTFRVKIIINISPLSNIEGGLSDQSRVYVFTWDGVTNQLQGDFSIFDFNDDFF